jgi:hypothetical protein
MIEFICIYALIVVYTTIAVFNPKDINPKREFIASSIVALIWPFAITIWLITIIFKNSRI